jgi:hypothetical protein
VPVGSRCCRRFESARSSRAEGVVFTLPAAIAKVAWHNKAVVYDLLFKASAETLLTIAANPRHLSAAASGPPAGSAI